MTENGRSDGVRERVLASARRLFNDRGINVTGVDLLSADAGVSKRTLYQRFHTKDELIAAYLAEENLGFFADLFPPADSDLPPASQIMFVFESIRSASERDGFHGCPVLNTTAELRGDATHPARVAAVTYKEDIERFFATQARRAGAADPDSLAEQLMMLFDGGMSYTAVRGKPIPESIFAAVRTLIDARL